MLILSFTFAVIANESDKDCVKWFEKARIELGSKDCELKCSLLKTDMGTFMCPNQCDRLCISNPKPPGGLIYYPGLTIAENELLRRYPGDAATVYFQKREAEMSTERNFPDQNLNDESDAFRHFVWAGLLTKKLGREKASKFLEAHEADPDQPEIHRQMDVYNNSKGQSATESLLKNKKWSLKNLESQALDALHKKELKVLKQGLPVPKEPK